MKRKKSSNKKIIFLIVVSLLIVAIFSIFYIPEINKEKIVISRYAECDKVDCESLIRETVRKNYYNETFSMELHEKLMFFMNSENCQRCDLKIGEQVFLYHQTGSIWIGGCYIDDPLYNEEYLENEEIHIVYPHQQAVGLLGKTYQGFTAKKTGKTVVVASGTCNRERLYEINIER